MRNKGVEFTINTHLNLGKVLWSSSFNIARNVNKLTSLLEDDLLSIGANRALKLGRTVGSWYIFRTDGIYQYDGEVPQALYDKGVRAGDVKYWDRNGDGNITDDDRIVTGNPNPKFSGGWNNTFKYKGLELSLFFTYSYGNDVYASWMIPGSKPGHTRSLQKAYADNRWTGPGTSDKYPRAIYSYSGWNGKNSTMYLTDGSFIRLRSVTLGYTFRSGWFRKKPPQGRPGLCHGRTTYFLSLALSGRRVRTTTYSSSLRTRPSVLRYRYGR